MKRPQYSNYEHRKRGLFPKDWVYDQRKYIDQVEAENKDANEFIKDIAKLLNIDADGIGFDGLTLSIEDFQGAIKEKDVVISEYHTKMIADKESYFEVVEAHDDLERELKEVKEENKKLKEASSILNTIGKDTPCPTCHNKMNYKPRLYHCNYCGSDFN